VRPQSVYIHLASCWMFCTTTLNEHALSCGSTAHLIRSLSLGESASLGLGAALL
jgi:hypothetical protein